MQAQGQEVNFDVMMETLRATSLGGLQKGSRVNFERAAKFGDEVGSVCSMLMQCGKYGCPDFGQFWCPINQLPITPPHCTCGGYLHVCEVVSIISGQSGPAIAGACPL